MPVVILPESPAPDPIEFEYDTLSNLRFAHDQLGHTTEYQYDARKRLKTEIDANLHETTYQYYDDGQIHTLEDPNGNITEWVYDGAGRVATETNELDHTRSYLYDEFNRLSQLTDREGRVTTFDYDHFHRLTDEKWYTDQNHLDTGEQNPLHTLHYAYDDVGQLDLASAASQSAGTYVTYDYNDYNHLGLPLEVRADLAGLPGDVVFTQRFAEWPRGDATSPFRLDIPRFARSATAM